MNNILIIYASKHLGNTKRLIEEASAKVDFIDIVSVENIDAIDWTRYKTIGFASGVNGGRVYTNLSNFIKEQEGSYKNAFTILTSGTSNEKYNIRFRNVLEESNFTVRNQFICKGENHFFISRLLGKTNKGYPTQVEVDSLVKFLKTQKRRFIDEQ